MTENGKPAGRVLYVIHHREYSGAETLHVPVLIADGDAVLACPPGSETERLYHEAGVRTAPLGFRVMRHSGGLLELLRSIPRGFAAARELRGLLREHPEREAVYGVGVRPGMLASVASLGLGRKVVWYLSDFLPPWPVRAAALALTWLRCDRVIAISDCVADEARGVPSGQIRTVYPGIDVGLFDPSLARPGEPRAAILGHVSPTKRTDLAVDIAGLVGAAVPGFELDVIGRAQYRDEDFEFERNLHQRVAADPALSAHVNFVGYKRDVAEALQGYGLLVHTRDDEPFGMVVVEAMAAGLPVVAPRSAGPAEIVDDGVTGFLYEPGDARSAADAAIRILQDPELARKMSEAGRRRAEEHFDATRQTARLAAAIP